MSRRIRFNLHGSYGDPFFDNLQARSARVMGNALHMDRNYQLAKDSGTNGMTGIYAAAIRYNPRLRRSRKLKKSLKATVRYKFAQELPGCLPVLTIADIPEPYATDLDAFTYRFMKIQGPAPIGGVTLK
ncbi:hypothetical protein ACIP5Z_01590 [Rothia terrae]|uniref:hypothetical protein n=1 Tax=Rothia terrae TaxID=396015 RepID=UPI00380D083F